MNKLDISEIKRLYAEEHLSVPTIATRCNRSQWSIYKLMRKHGVSRRSSAESNRHKFEASATSFTPRVNLSPYEENLKQAALMLYWAEGSKRTSHTVDFSNSDPEMILLFVKCLREVYGVSETRLRILLYCYANQSVEQLLDFWSSLTKIPLNQFSRPYVRENTAAKYHVMPYGLVHIRYSDQRLFKRIQEDTRITIDNMLGWQSGQLLLTVISSLSPKGELKSG